MKNINENTVAAYAGTADAVAVNSETSELHLAVRALSIGKGDEVITTPFSFVASSNCVLFENAIPKFADILPTSLCIDPDAVERAITPRTKVIIGVDVFGHPAARVSEFASCFPSLYKSQRFQAIFTRSTTLTLSQWTAVTRES